jgi:hypothetical protein
MQGSERPIPYGHRGQFWEIWHAHKDEMMGAPVIALRAQTIDGWSVDTSICLKYAPKGNAGRVGASVLLATCKRHAIAVHLQGERRMPDVGASYALQVLVRRVLVRNSSRMDS